MQTNNVYTTVTAQYEYKPATHTYKQTPKPTRHMDLQI